MAMQYNELISLVCLYFHANAMYHRHSPHKSTTIQSGTCNTCPSEGLKVNLSVDHADNEGELILIGIRFNVVVNIKSLNCIVKLIVITAEIRWTYTYLTRFCYKKLNL